jgi:hypothetical protein
MVLPDISRSQGITVIDLMELIESLPADMRDKPVSVCLQAIDTFDSRVVSARPEGDKSVLWLHLEEAFSTRYFKGVLRAALRAAVPELLQVYMMLGPKRTPHLERLYDGLKDHLLAMLEETTFEALKPGDKFLWISPMEKVENPDPFVDGIRSMKIDTLNNTYDRMMKNFVYLGDGRSGFLEDTRKVWRSAYL